MHTAAKCLAELLKFEKLKTQRTQTQEGGQLRSYRRHHRLGIKGLLTTLHPGILKMEAIVNPKPIVPTIKYRLFVSSTSDIIQQNLQPVSTAKGSPYRSPHRSAEIKFSADDHGVVQVPSIIADSSPSTTWEHLHATFARSRTVCQSNFRAMIFFALILFS